MKKMEISKIQIKNFATIAELDIEFAKGLNIITGETGAGKSVLATAIGAVFNPRANKTLIRNNTDEAAISLTFTDGTNDTDIKRIITKSYSKRFIDDASVSAAELAENYNDILHIHGQFENQDILNPDNHISIIDSFGENTVLPVKKDYDAYYSRFKAAAKELNDLLKKKAEIEQQRDFMQFQLNELEKAKLSDPNEDKAIDESLSTLKNTEKIYTAINDSFLALYKGNSSAYENLSTAIHALENIPERSPEFESLLNNIISIQANIEEASDVLRELGQKYNYSPAELTSREDRSSELTHLKNKYMRPLNEIIQFKEQLRNKLDSSQQIDAEIKSKENNLAELKTNLIEAAKKLSAERLNAAKVLISKIEDELKELNFTNPKITLSHTSLSKYSQNGNDSIEFLISTNVGQAPKPLAKIISGGEASRIMLAIKKVLLEIENIPIIIFDEIDSGISGKTASIVGKKLHEISRGKQVICITHSPQIAAFGDHNYLISKSSDDSNTYTDAKKLNPDEKINEIAKLIGGIHITENNIISAKELMENCKNF